MADSSANPPEPQVVIHGSYVDTSFITASLDDAGLTPYEFRVYCRILRRAQGKNGKPYCYETQGRIAEAIGIHRNQVTKAMKVLRQRRMIHVEKKKGNWLHVWPLPSAMWVGTANDLALQECNLAPSECNPLHPQSATQGTPVQGAPEKEKPTASPISPEEEKGKTEPIAPSTGAPDKSGGDLFATCVHIWNEHRRPEWVQHSVLDNRAKGQIRRLAQWHKQAAAPGSPVDAFRAAISWAAQREKWCQDRKGTTLVEIGANEKLIQYAEKAAQLAAAPTPLDSKSKRLLGQLVTPERVFEAGSEAIFQMQPVKVIGRAGPLYRIRTAEGAEITAYPDELGVREQEEDE